MKKTALIRAAEVEKFFRDLLIGEEPDTQSAPDPRQFADTPEGSGTFGQWFVDEHGLPAYRYALDQYKHPQAAYPNSVGRDWRSHWHQIGNDRLTALASNDGTVQVLIGDRGPTFLNKFEVPERRTFHGFRLSLMRWLYQEFFRLTSRRIDRQVKINRVLPGVRQRPMARQYAYAGGYSYVHDGEVGWATAYRYRPGDARADRVFGAGYFLTMTEHRNIRITRRTHAPTRSENMPHDEPLRKDHPVIIVDVEISNRRSFPVEMVHYEYWDVNIHQLKLQWLRTGLSSIIGDEERQVINRAFTPTCSWDADHNALVFQQHMANSPFSFEQPSRTDWSPPGVFLADLTSDAAPTGFLMDMLRFFGKGDAYLPDAVRNGRTQEATEAETTANEAMPNCLVLCQRVRLEPGESTTLRYAYGALPPGESLEFLDHYRLPEAPFAQHISRWRDRLSYFDTGQDPILQRETTWHTYSLLSATLYHDYYKAHRVPQGSAYFFSHGADGAPRDLALYVLPLTYIRPKLAREMLVQLMSLQFAGTGGFTYAFGGYGIHSDARGLHKNPSDLDLFFLLAITEYLSATGDFALLDTEVPFYPQHAPITQDSTVLHHLQVTVFHLLDTIGTGEHGLMRIGSGDWSDAIVVETSLRDGPEGYAIENSKDDGESIPNTQMALYVLPRFANLIEPYDAELAQKVREPLEHWQRALLGTWNGEWFVRAILRDIWSNSIYLGEDMLDLEAQVWALIGDWLDDDTRQTLLQSIRREVDDPSPIGGSLVTAQVWPAISQLLTWGYTNSDPRLAWRSLNRNTMAMRGLCFPNQWFNIWSGPDGVSISDGSTWASPVTPITDFPVMNSNLHAMALLGLLRLCGIEPRADGQGLVIAPKIPREQFILDTPLLRLEVGPNRIAGDYHAVASGTRLLTIHRPADKPFSNAQVADQPIPISDPHAVSIDLVLDCIAGKSVSFVVDFLVG